MEPKGTSATTIVLVVLAILVIGGIIYGVTRSSSPTTSTATATATAATTTSGNTTAIAISNSAFATTSVTIKVGDTVTWTNQDSIAHTVTSTDGGPLNSGNLAKSATYSYTFTKAGTYAYQCSYHPYMTGTVTVQ